MGATLNEPSFRRAAILMMVTSFLVPLGGLITAPILARALSTDGRGEMAAALAPAALMLAAATLGLPDALTFHLARRPSLTRVGLLWSSMATVLVGLASFAVTALFLPFLSAGDEQLGSYILLASAWTIPALVVGVLRGAAIGRQMWRAVSLERIIMTVLRVIAFAALWLTGMLTVYSAVMVSVLLPIISGLVYVVLLRKPPYHLDKDVGDHLVGIRRSLFSFGPKVWMGSVASMLISRLAPLLMVPFSTVSDLGLYTVASTISDVPLIVALAIQGALFGVNSRSNDAARVTSTARLTLLAAIVGCVVIGGTLPFWIGRVFGSDFVGATIPSIMLLISAIVCIPGLMAASGLSAWGRPALRSIGLAITLVANLGAFLLLVPHFGVYGAAWTSIISNVVMSTYMVIMASRVIGAPIGDFFILRGGDVVRGWNEGVAVLHRLTHLRSRSRATADAP